LTQCAFAHDVEKFGGGSIVMGRDIEQDGQPVVPQVGLKPNRLDKIQEVPK
jgi:ATP-dependent DNA helicase RecG